MKNNIFIFFTLIITFFAYSCEDNNEEVNLSSINSSEICLDNQIIVDNEVPEEIIRIGEAHNRLLELLDGNLTISDRCSNTQLTTVQNIMDNAIDTDSEFSSLFGSSDDMTDITITDFYINEIGMCEVNAEFDSKIKSWIDQSLVSSSGIIPEYEIDFIDDFFEKILESQSKIDLEPYYSNIKLNKEKFLDNGDLSYTVLAIYDYSSCFWLNRENEEITTRILPWLIKAAASDAVGAWYGGVKHAVQNNGTSGDGQVLHDMARGAVSASIPIVGGDLYDWVTGG